MSRAALYWEQNADRARAILRVNKHSLTRKSGAQDRNDGRWFTGLKKDKIELSSVVVRLNEQLDFPYR